MTPADIVIIGAGPAGLYCAMKCVQHHKTRRIVLLESSQYIGGRATNVPFGSHQVYPGAAHIMPDNALLLDLLEKYNVSKVKLTLDIRRENKRDIEGDLEKLFSANDSRAKTFLDLMISTFDGDVSDFINDFGYTDMLNADIEDTFYGYGLAEYLTGSHVYMADFAELWSRVLGELKGNTRFVYKDNHNAYITEWKEGAYHVTHGSSLYKARYVYVCTGLHACKKVTERVIDTRVLDSIGTNRFAKLFVNLREAIPHNPARRYLKIWHTNSIFQRVMQYSSKLLCIYVDNDSVDKLCSVFDDTATVEHELARVVGAESLDIESVRYYYWPSGTHYFKPFGSTDFISPTGVPVDLDSRDDYIRMCQSPRNGLYIAGEMISKKQGSIEGALESVEKLFM